MDDPGALAVLNRKKSGRPSRRIRASNGSFCLAADGLIVTQGNGIGNVGEGDDLFEDITLNPKVRKKMKVEGRITRSTDVAVEDIENNMAAKYNEQLEFEKLNTEGVKLYQLAILRSGPEQVKTGDNGLVEGNDQLAIETLGSRLFSFNDVEK